MAGWRSLGHLIILITIIWALFIIVSASLAYLISSAVEVQSFVSSLARVGAGLVIFTAWVVAWERLVEIWLYRIMLRRRG